ncbi:electron transport complex subunit E [Sulfuriferula thiophila]|uniref:electron transport complex subunit E n=1 Tax=Sulfuriferula thiophila TaxID=1781211 RepID=UPI000F615DEE|nr:electron transport complex subunit E [Sulfuriferula thiophila]
MNQYREIIINGLWKQNPGVVQLLGLCPLLAISNNIVNAVGLGIATTLVMAFSNGAVSAIRDWVSHEIRIPVFILIIAALVTVIDMAMNAFIHPLYLVLGIFVPLIVTNCIVLARTEAFAAKNPVLPAMLDGFMMGLGVTLVLTLLGALRELVGKGTLLSGIDLAFGASAKAWVIHVIPDYNGFLIAILPPGAFFGLGLLIALRNWWVQRAERQPATIPNMTAATSMS